MCTDFVGEWILKIKMSKDDISIADEKKTNAILTRNRKWSRSNLTEVWFDLSNWYVKCFKLNRNVIDRQLSNMGEGKSQILLNIRFLIYAKPSNVTFWILDWLLNIIYRYRCLKFMWPSRNIWTLNDHPHIQPLILCWWWCWQLAPRRTLHCTVKFNNLRAEMSTNMSYCF